MSPFEPATPATDPRLNEVAAGALRRAARAARPEEVVDAELRDLIRQVCELAHDRGLQAEQLLRLLKEAWWALPETRRLARHDAGDLLARAITLCIDEYYADRDGRRG